jgi:MerR family redox-sensitive transcriptional activator SoxR
VVRPAVDGPLLAIGEVAERSGTPITTLRFYERRGLIEPPRRVSGQRRYEASVLMRLMVIRFCRIAGLSLDEIGEVLTDRSRGRSATKRLARRRVEAIDAQIAELQLARRMMRAAAECRCPTMDECRCGAMPPVIAEMREFAAAGGVTSAGTAVAATTAGRRASRRPPT